MRAHRILIIVCNGASFFQRIDVIENILFLGDVHWDMATVDVIEHILVFSIYAGLKGFIPA